MDILGKTGIFVYLCLFGLFCKSTIFASVRFVRYAELDGYGCKSGDTIFQIGNVYNKFACSVFCTQDETCFGFFYQSETQECTGCRADFDDRLSKLAMLNESVYFTRNDTYHNLKFMDAVLDGYRCGTDYRIVDHSSVQTLDQCRKSCLEEEGCQSYFYQPDTQHCTECRIAYGINGVGPALEEWTDSVYFSRYQYLGCFDNYHPRILEGIFTSSGDMTTESCIQRCISEGRMYALIEVGSFCQCGNELTPHGIFADAACNYGCLGDTSQSCGGEWKGSVYIIRLIH